MNVTSFINSEAVATHLQEIGFEFSTLQAAYVVWSNQTKPLKKRLATLSKIMETMPDCYAPYAFDENLKELLFPMLKQYIQLQESLMAEFFADGEAIYTYSYVCINGDSDYYSDTFYRDLDSCMKAALSSNKHEMFRIEKRWFDIERRIAVVLTEEKEVYDIEPYYLSDEENKVQFFFKKIDVAFPIPFRKGDILTEKNPLGKGSSEPFVFEGGKKSRECIKVQYDGSITDFYIENCLNLEYYTKELTGYERILKAYSKYAKGDWSLLKYLRAVILIVHDTDAHTNDWRFGDDEILEFLGMKEEEK